MEFDLETLREAFVSETDERLSLMEAALLRLEKQPGDADAVDEVFRIVHTIKGDAAMVEAEGLSRFAHRLEDLLDALRDGRAQIDEKLVTILLRSVDLLRESLENPEKLLQTVEEARPRFAPLLEELEAGTPAPTSPHGEQAHGPEQSQAASATGLPKSATAEHTLRIDVQRLDELMNLVGEIAVARSRQSQLLRDPQVDLETLREAHLASEWLHEQVQQLAMELRMVPVGPVLSQYARTVRDLARKWNVDAALTVTGGDIELDNSVLQRLRDPLRHMVQNAVTHGIESPDERKAAGKPAQGRVELRVRRSGSGLILELEDDGRGIDWSAVLDRARRLGLTDPDEEPTRQALSRLLFAPGLSTAAEVTQAAGRGVGMDVVLRQVESLRGSIDIDSEEGRGTLFRIELPLTLAIIDGLQVEAGPMECVVPVDSVVETVGLPDDALPPGKKRGVTRLREQTVQVVRLRRVFGHGGRAEAREVVVVTRAPDGGLVGVVVDAVLGKGQFVVKPLPKVYQNVAGISGSAVLGSGEVALILDIPDLLRSLRSDGDRHGAGRTGSATTEPFRQAGLS